MKEIFAIWMSQYAISGHSKVKAFSLDDAEA